jgi:aminomethyltransferase
MVPFGGWHMPVQYRGVLEEHRAVRTRAGLFDVSHMGEAVVRGPQSLEFLERVTCNHVLKLPVGRCHYSALTTEAGTFVDDLLVYREGPDAFFLVLNASNTAKDVAWLRAHVAPFDAEVVDESPRWAQLALQGPRAAEILRGKTSADPEALKYYAFFRCDVFGVPSILSRTGYTGEDGFEIYAPPEAAAELWRNLMAAGEPQGLVPVGLAARDTLRLEAKMALYGNDIDDTTTVIEADLGWIVKEEKGDFLGRAILARQKREGVARKLVGFRTEGRAIARHGFAAFRGGDAVGAVTSGSFAPTLEANVGLVYLPAGMWEPGTRFEIEIRGRREPATVVPTPFYRRPR